MFERLCFTLKSLNLLEDDRHVCLKEAIGIFLLTDPIIHVLEW